MLHARPQAGRGDRHDRRSTATPSSSCAPRTAAIARSSSCTTATTREVAGADSALRRRARAPGGRVEPIRRSPFASSATAAPRCSRSRCATPRRSAAIGSRPSTSRSRPQPQGPITLTDHVARYEIVGGADWHQLVAIDLATGKGVLEERARRLRRSPMAGSMASNGLGRAGRKTPSVRDPATGADRPTE